MQFETLLWKVENHIGVLQIHRPQSLNALNSQVLMDLEAWLGLVEKDSSLKGVILTGAGEKAFVAGADIKEISDLSEASGLEFAKRGQAVFSRIEALGFPVIAAVNGFALGGGCELALSCDFIVASKKAKFGLPEVGLGLLPGFGGTVRATRVLGLPRAKEMIFTGGIYTGDEAFAIGLANHVVEPEQLMPECIKILAMAKSKAPLAIRAAKIAILQGYSQSLEEAMTTERNEFSSLCGTQDMREGTAAFIEKRAPQFKGN
jgi:enoyl-CoA hydratase